MKTAFINFRPMMQKLMNFEYFHQQKFKKKKKIEF